MYDPKKPDYKFGGQDGSRPIIIQEGRVYDLKGVSLDEAYQQDNTAENIIQYLWQNNYCCTPEARRLLIAEKQRVALRRQAEDLERRNALLMQEEMARIEASLAESEKQLRDLRDLHIAESPKPKAPLPLTEAELAILSPDGGVRVPEPEYAPPEELEEAPLVKVGGKKRK